MSPLLLMLLIVCTSALTCPNGAIQIGETNADIPGCGLEGCDARYQNNYPTIEACQNGCISNSNCLSYSWAPMNGDKNHQGTTVCTLYNSDVPTNTWSPMQIMCKLNELTINPTIMPTYAPSFHPTQSPSQNPSQNPSENPTFGPTQYPSTNPTIHPTVGPTKNPSFPTAFPSAAPTDQRIFVVQTPAPILTDSVTISAIVSTTMEPPSISKPTKQKKYLTISILPFTILSVTILCILVTLICYYIIMKKHSKKKKVAQINNRDWDYKPLVEVEMNKCNKTMQCEYDSIVSDVSTTMGPDTVPTKTQTGLMDDEHITPNGFTVETPVSEIGNEYFDEVIESDDENNFYTKPNGPTKTGDISGQEPQVIHFYYMDYMQRNNEHKENMEIHFEKQKWELCLMHALNGLLQEQVFTVKKMNKICKDLAPEKWINPHKSVFQTGNYDVNVLMMALGRVNVEVKWFDARKANQLDLCDGQLLESDEYELVGFVLNNPSKAAFKMIKRRHWIAIKKIRGIWYNLDSKLKRPKRYKNREELTVYLKHSLAENNAELMICSKKKSKKDKEKNVERDVLLKW